MTDDVGVPAALRQAIVRDLRPVTPLRSPGIRALAVAPLAFTLLVASVIVFNLRVDAPVLGLLLTWGVSTAQMGLGLLLTVAALREAIPGTTIRRGAIVAALGTAVAAIVLVTLATWSVSPTRVAARAAAFVWKVCFGATLASALPPLAVSAWLVARAYPLRPSVAGALYGAGAGLMADAGWRLFCHYSDPLHVFGAHTAAVAGATVIGALAARGIASAARTP
jgi:hypothetical protein